MDFSYISFHWTTSFLSRASATCCHQSKQCIEEIQRLFRHRQALFDVWWGTNDFVNSSAASALNRKQYNSCSFDFMTHLSSTKQGSPVGGWIYPEYSVAWMTHVVGFDYWQLIIKEHNLQYSISIQYNIIQCSTKQSSLTTEQTTTLRCSPYLNWMKKLQKITSPPWLSRCGSGLDR